jgi:hypothetical protein
MALRSVCSACDRESYATFAKIDHRMGDQNLLTRALHRVSEGRLHRWSWPHLESFALTIRTGPAWWVMTRSSYM